MQPQPMKTPAQIAAIFGCTVEQARQQLRHNASDYRKAQAKAAAKNGKVGGFTADQWAQMADGCEQAAKA